MWVDTHRPETFDEIVGNEETIEEIRSNVEQGEIPHMAFFGPAGIGKTTTAEIIARSLYGTVDNSSFKELNASDTRGIDTIRTEVKKFARRKSLDGSYKIVFLDEADSLTPDAMQSLRRIMEQYQDTCRFILTGNYPENIIDALKSRCNTFEFEPVDDNVAADYLMSILEEEGYADEVEYEFVHKLASIYHGDIRKQVVKLESAVTSGQTDPDSLDAGENYAQLFSYLMKPNYMAAVRNVDRQTMDQLFNFIMQKDNIPGRVKADVSIIFAKYDWRMKKSADEKIQLNAMVSELIKRLQKHKNG